MGKVNFLMDLSGNTSFKKNIPEAGIVFEG